MKKSKVSPPHAADRDAILERPRSQKMARSSHRYVRGNTRQFYEWLDSPAAVGVPEGPPVWICGDCHVGNLGPVVNAAGEIRIHIRDLDIKVAVESAAPGATGARMRAPDRPVFIRELMPQDLKHELDQDTTSEGLKAARYLSRTLPPVCLDRSTGPGGREPVSQLDEACATDESLRRDLLVAFPCGPARPRVARPSLPRARDSS